VSTQARAWLAAVLFLAGLAASSVVCGQTKDYYIVDGQRIELEPSKDYDAVAVRPSGRGVFMASAANSASAEPVRRATILDRYNIVLLKKKANASFGAFSSSVNLLSKHSAVRADVPVYSMGGAEQVLVNEFSVQAASPEQAGELATVLKAKGANVVAQDDPEPGRYVITFPDKQPREALAVVNDMNGATDTKGAKLVRFAAPNFVRITAPPPKDGDKKPAPAAPGAPKPKTAAPGPGPGPQSTVGPASVPSGVAVPPTASAPRVPNDPDLEQQWALEQSTGINIGAEAAWKLSKGSKKVPIAIIDEGVDIHHPDLKDKILTPYDATDEDDDQQPFSWNPHGTRCAGMASASTNNGLGIAGVSWESPIIPVRVAYSAGAGQGWITSDRILEKGIRVAVDRGALVLSNSWGGGTPSPLINSAIDYAIAKKRVVVFAAGNRGAAVDYPANLAKTKDIIAVSATNERDEFKTTDSSDGEDWWASNFGDAITLAAPGVHNLTTDLSDGENDSPSNYVATFNGTSSATPLVSGAAALLLAIRPDATPAQIKRWLTRSAKDLGPPGMDTKFGAGRLDLSAALRLAINSKPLKVAFNVKPDWPRVGFRDQVQVSALVTRDGEPVPGVSVAFKSNDTGKASFLEAVTLTDERGIAQTQLRGEAILQNEAEIEAQVETPTTDAEYAKESSDKKVVKVPFMPWWTAALVLLAGVPRRRGALKQYAA
jgi:subtilisin family serine protease